MPPLQISNPAKMLARYQLALMYWLWFVFASWMKAFRSKLKVARSDVATYGDARFSGAAVRPRPDVPLFAGDVRGASLPPFGCLPPGLWSHTIRYPPVGVSRPAWLAVLNQTS